MKKTIFKSTFLLSCLFAGNLVFAQSASINADGSEPDASAILDLKSTSAGFLAPRMNTTERMNISSPAEGLIVYDTDLLHYMLYDGAGWQSFSYTASGSESADVPTNPVAGQRYFDEVSETLYIYTGSGWAPITAGTPSSSPYSGGGGSATTTLVFGSITGNAVEIASWNEEAGIDGYVVLANSTNSFTSLVDGESADASATYASNGQQVVFDGTSSTSTTITLLEEEKAYYFKIVPYSGSRVYDNDQAVQSATTTACSTDSETESEICLSISGNLLTISSNQVPNHVTGNFPNYEGPSGEEFLATQRTVEIDYTPTVAGSVTYVFNESGGPTPMNQNFYKFGIASNGIGYNPMGLKPWSNPTTAEENWEWQAAVINEGDTDLDAYGGHVTSQGVYHYHGDVSLLAADEDGSKHSALYGWAADGFPIYYKYGYTAANDAATAIKELTSSYQLKSGSRTGTGTAGEDYPDGDYDGTYIQDYEYVDGLGDLDECNGRTGVTPEYPAGTYYYVITSDFPKIPNCMVGTPSEDFNIGN
ncbi:MAG: YHYH protein [Cyclobacteriaceae bacterium]